MIKDTVYSFMAEREMEKLVKTHGIRNGVEAFMRVLRGFDISTFMCVIFQAVPQANETAIKIKFSQWLKKRLYI